MERMNNREKLELLMHLQDKQFMTAVEEVELQDALTCIAMLDQMAVESNKITVELFIQQVESSLSQQYTYQALENMWQLWIATYSKRMLGK